MKVNERKEKHFFRKLLPKSTFSFLEMTREGIDLRTYVRAHNLNNLIYYFEQNYQ